MNGRIKGFACGIAAAFAVLMLSGPALADGYKAAAPKPEARRCNLSANVALTTEYVFRGCGLLMGPGSSVESRA